MPNLLKKLMKRSSSSSRRQHPANVPQVDLLASPTRPSSHYDTDELTDLAQKVLKITDSQQLEPDQNKHAGKSAEKSELNYLADQVGHRLQLRAAAETVDARSAKENRNKDKRSKAKMVDPVETRQAACLPPPRWAGDDGQKVLDAMTESIEMVNRLQADDPENRLPRTLLPRCGELLLAQRDEVKDAAVYMERGRYPALRTLRQVYERVLTGLTELEQLDPPDARSEVETLVQLLEEGPDYLIDTFLIELIVHHAETLDSALAAEVKDIYKKAVARPGDLAMFRRAAQGIVAYASAIPEEDLEDEMGREAYRTIGILVKQLKLRVEGEPAVSSEASSSYRAPQSILKKPSTTTAASSDDDVEVLGADALEARFGTGPLPARSLAPNVSASAIENRANPLPGRGETKAPPPASPASSTSSLDSISLYDYRGQILTASALDLVLRQEALALADSTGQYTGDVSWDDIRQAWIPNWVVKLKPDDLAPGEIPSMNPADYEVKKEDDFGNKIGWTDEGEMYYEEEPSFELK